MVESRSREGDPAVDERAIRQHLERVLASREFSGSQRLQAFLRFVAEFSLTNRAAELKEYLIAVEVYGHSPDYDPQAKSTVRVEASRLRSRLRDYYESSGRDDPVRIDIPKGSYAPIFSWTQPPVSASHPESPPPVAAAPRPARIRTTARWWPMAAILAAGAVAGAVFLLRPAGNQTPYTVSAIAVLPFVNLNASPEDERLCDGVTEAVTAALARTPGLRVPSRTALAGLKGKPVDVRKLAAEHQVNAFVEGSLRREGARYLLTAQLIDTREGYHLWAETFDRTTNSPLDFEQQVATEIAAALTERIAGRVPWRRTGRPAPSSEAWALHLKAHDLLRRDPRTESWPKGLPPHFREAIGMMERATRLEPDFAEAWSTLANALLISSELAPGERRPMLDRATAAAKRAIQADPTLAEPHSFLGDIALYADWDFPEAEAALRRAIELNPRDPYAQMGYADVLRITGRAAEAKIELARALTLDPNNAKLRVQNALHLYDDGRCAEVTREADEALTLRPNLTMAYWIKGLCRESERDWAAAEREFQAALNLAPQDSRALPAIGHLYAVSGRRKQAERIREKLQELRAAGKPVAYAIALIQTGLGEKGDAFAWLNRGLAERDPSMPYLGVEQRFIPLRGDSRWSALISSLRLQP